MQQTCVRDMRASRAQAVHLARTHGHFARKPRTFARKVRASPDILRAWRTFCAQGQTFCAHARNIFRQDLNKYARCLYITSWCRTCLVDTIAWKAEVEALSCAWTTVARVYRWEVHLCTRESIIEQICQISNSDPYILIFVEKTWRSFPRYKT